MALQKVKELNSGVTGNYCKLEIILLTGTKTSCIVHLYKDSDARQTGKATLESTGYSWSGDENPCTIDAMNSDNPIKLCYEKLKTLEEFSGAQDV